MIMLFSTFIVKYDHKFYFSNHFISRPKDRENKQFYIVLQRCFKKRLQVSFVLFKKHLYKQESSVSWGFDEIFIN